MVVVLFVDIARDDGHTMTHENELKDLLGLVQSSGMQCPQTLALFYDELAVILTSMNMQQMQQHTSSISSQIDRQSLNWFVVSASDMFQDAFLNDSNTSFMSNSIDLNSTCLVYNFDEQINDAAVLNLANIVSKYHQYRTMSDTTSSPILLAPMLRLIVVASWPNIDRVDTILQCSLRIPDFIPNNLLNIDSTRTRNVYREQLNCLSNSSLTILCDVYYYASRLFREICNLLGSTSQCNDRLFTIRLEQLTDIEEHFSLCVQVCRHKGGFYEPICSNQSTNQLKKLTKRVTSNKAKTKKPQGTK
jgi:hypothetical protein